MKMTACPEHLVEYQVVSASTSATMHQSCTGALFVRLETAWKLRCRCCGSVDLDVCVCCAPLAAPGWPWWRWLWCWWRRGRKEAR